MKEVKLRVANTTVDDYAERARVRNPIRDDVTRVIVWGGVT